jgi:hypothetical protein
MIVTSSMSVEYARKMTEISACLLVWVFNSVSFYKQYKYQNHWLLVSQMLRFYLHWWDINCQNGHMQNLNFLQFRYFVIFWSLVLACWYECLIVFHFTNNKNIKTTLFLCIHIYIKSAWYKPTLTWNKNNTKLKKFMCSKFTPNRNQSLVGLLVLAQLANTSDQRT